MDNPFPTERDQKRRYLFDAVDSVRDVVSANADKAEDLRTLPQETVDALYETGLFKLKLPTELGGAEADPVTQIEVYEAMTRIDTSAGWALIIGAGSLGLAGGFLPDQAVKHIFVDDGGPKFAGSTAPPGSAVPQEPWCS
ncbi:MAG: acyl-CoA dehydrogenase family protein [Candidatus Tectomicrobia bacterium]|nr:acyl-CoA dehydrogenase family protein [Candidatus Tectomicrobia bacterium]